LGQNEMSHKTTLILSQTAVKERETTGERTTQNSEKQLSLITERRSRLGEGIALMQRRKEGKDDGKEKGTKEQLRGVINPKKGDSKGSATSVRKKLGEKKQNAERGEGSSLSRLNTLSPRFGKNTNRRKHIWAETGEKNMTGGSTEEGEKGGSWVRKSV